MYMIHIKVVYICAIILPNNLQLPITSGPSLTCCNVSAAVQFRSVIAYIYTIVHVNH